MSRIGSWRPRARERVAHTALFYLGEREYLDGVRTFIREAINTGSPVLIAVPRSGLRRIQAGLNGDLARVELADMTELGANPARIIPAIRAALDAHAGRTLYFVGEPVWAERSQDEISEAMCHEALINRVFASARVRILCPYNLTALEAPTIADAECTHQWLSDGDGRRASSSYNARKLPSSAHAPLSIPPSEAVSLRFELADLVGVRALVSEHAARAGLTVGQCGNAVLAANEIATNSIRHGGGTGTLHCWHEHGRMICQVSDAGHIRDPLVGRVRPDASARSGRGLWLVNQLCDLVQIRTGRGGTIVRIHARRHEAGVRQEHEPTIVGTRAT